MAPPIPPTSARSRISPALPNDARAARAHRHAQRDFLASRRRAHQQQRGEVDGPHQQDGADDGERDGQDVAGIEPGTVRPLRAGTYAELGDRLARGSGVSGGRAAQSNT